MKPLTIEQLKSLEVGDWVWIVVLKNDLVNKAHNGKYYHIQHCGGWGDKELWCGWQGYGTVFNYSDYGTKWVAYKNKEQAESKGDLYQTAFELILQDVYDNRLKADTLSCSSCPFMEEVFDECQNQGLYEDCKKRWEEYYLKEAEHRLAELKGE